MLTSKVAYAYRFHRLWFEIKQTAVFVYHSVLTHCGTPDGGVFVFS